MYSYSPPSLWLVSSPIGKHISRQNFETEHLLYSFSYSCLLSTLPNSNLSLQALTYLTVTYPVTKNVSRFSRSEFNHGQLLIDSFKLLTCILVALFSWLFAKNNFQCSSITTYVVLNAITPKSQRPTLFLSFKSLLLPLLYTIRLQLNIER